MNSKRIAIGLRSIAAAGGLLVAFALSASGATLKNIVNLTDEEFVRVGIEVEGEYVWKHFVLHDPERIVVDIAGARVAAAPGTFEARPLKGVRAGDYATETVRVVLDLEYLMPFEVVQSASGSLEVKIRRNIPEERERRTIAPGISHERVAGMTSAGPLTYHVLEVDLRAGYRLGVTLGRDEFSGKEPLSAMVERTGAVAAVNGGYFDMKSGRPIDLLIAGGKVLSLPERYRAFFGVSGGRAVVLFPSVEASVACEGERLYAHRLNYPPSGAERAIFTEEYEGVRGAAGRREFAVSNGAVVLEGEVGTEVPAGGFVLSTAAGDAFCGGRPIGVGTRLEKVITSYPDLRAVDGGFSAGPALVEGGEARTSLLEDFTAGSGIVSRRNPRTAVGLKGKDRLVIVVVEGRSEWSAGLYLDELARLMAKFDVDTAMNFDGGGSSEAVAGGRILNRLSDGKERQLNNALMVYSTKQ